MAATAQTTRPGGYILISLEQAESFRQAILVAQMAALEAAKAQSFAECRGRLAEHRKGLQDIYARFTAFGAHQAHVLGKAEAAAAMFGTLAAALS